MTMTRVGHMTDFDNAREQRCVKEDKAVMVVSKLRMRVFSRDEHRMRRPRYPYTKIREVCSRKPYGKECKSISKMEAAVVKDGGQSRVPML